VTGTSEAAGRARSALLAGALGLTALACAGVSGVTEVDSPQVAAGAASSPLVLSLRSRRKVAGGEVEVVNRVESWEARHTAIVVCDMWDRHWCQGAERRVAALAGPMNAMLERARERGVFVLHAPSSVVHFYAGTPQRERARSAPFAATPVPLSTDERWGTTWCWPDPEREPGMPIDDSDMGCDCEPKCRLREPWTRQISDLRIDERDAISHDAQETWNLLRERDIEHVIIAGVHLNMCVLGRPFGIRQLVRLGLDVALMRDMTDSMYNSDRMPYVDHFRGTGLVVEYVERYWCPSVTSTDLTGRPAFRFVADLRGVSAGRGR
jgi:nicotinamidase-related amidase